MSLLDTRPVTAGTEVSMRPRVEGKFIFRGDEKMLVKGVTYGTFRPQPDDGNQFPDRAVVERDFLGMASAGLNAVRTYTVPPRWLLDLAQQHGLSVMVGLPWEQHVAFLDDKKLVRSIRRRVRQGVRECAGHPALLCFTIGNEIPAPIVRWHGRRKIEKFLETLYQDVRSEDPEALTTYVNFPTTEYLQLPFVDFLCFNVYLEQRATLEAYLARLHNLADDRPLVMAEVGLDSMRHGEERQSDVLDWQLETAFGAGCAGVFVFAWTDEWYRGGHDIEDWKFGLTTVGRQPKKALATVSRGFAQAPFRDDVDWPRISVVVCSYNGSRTIRQTMEELQKLDYPNYEVVVINDGSIDATPEIVSEFPVKLISTENRGLSAARNRGFQESTGEIVAYIDDDAYPDPHWLKYLANTFMSDDFHAAGGPNLVPKGDNAIAEAVGNAPGGPTHVLVTDRDAEHVPGCNMAYRKTALEAVGGFDPIYRAAGDDVDLCWRLLERGWRIGFSPSAFVWHHRRASIRTYWKQQVGYGKAEALLERKWPEKYNTAGHIPWTGRIYGKGLTEAVQVKKPRIYQGVWGTAAFQSLYQPEPSTLAMLPLMPEWLILTAILGLVSLLGLSWAPALLALPFFILAAAAPVAQAGLSALRARFTTPSDSRWEAFQRRFLTGVFHLMQPAARLTGRIKHGLTLWRRVGRSSWSFPRPCQVDIWSESWHDTTGWVGALEYFLGQARVPVRHGTSYDHWDAEVRGGLFGRARALLTVEEHGAGKQYARFRLRPRCSAAALVALLTAVGASAIAAAGGAIVASAGLGFGALVIAFRVVYESGLALGAMTDALDAIKEQRSAPSAT